MASTLCLMNDQIEFKACSLFTVNKALFYSVNSDINLLIFILILYFQICGAAFSYIFIMIQLDIGQDHKTVVNATK